MSDHLSKTIDQIVEQIQAEEIELSGKRKMVNSLCAMAGRPPYYTEVEDRSAANSGIRSDEFYGKKLATAVRMVLDKRRARGAASVQDIFEALKEGGFHFQSKNDDYAKRGLYQSLQKNSSTFHRLPSGKYGLLSWYPAVKPAKDKAAAEVEDEEPAEDMDDEVSAEADADVSEEAAEPVAPKPR